MSQVKIVPSAPRVRESEGWRVGRPVEESDCLLLFGQEGPGISQTAGDGASFTVSIAQFGSTRSINAGVAAGIAMHAWIRQWSDISSAW